VHGRTASTNAALTITGQLGEAPSDQIGAALR